MVWLATFRVLPNLFRMRRHFCLLLTLLGVAWSGVTSRATTLPPVAGELAGEIKLRALAGAPPLAWRVEIQPVAEGRLHAVVTGTAPGLSLRAEATQPVDGSAGEWRIIDATVDLALWQKSAAAAAEVTLPADLSVVGLVRLSGSGSLENLTPAGLITAELSGGRAGSATQGWEVAEVDLNGTLALRDREVALQTARLRIAVATVSGVVARNLAGEAAGLPDGSVELRSVSAEVFGGRVALAPFHIDLRAPSVHTAAELTSVAMSEIAALVPEALAEARGRLSGRLELNWSVAKGFEPGRGQLNILPDEPAALRLAATPGFLTQHLPERFQWLPDMFGRMAQWLAPKNPAYDDLRHIELGEQSLVVEQLRVELYPDGVTGPRSALVEVAARPPAGSAVENLRFTVNVAGPLQQVLALGLNDKAKIGFSFGAKK